MAEIITFRPTPEAQEILSQVKEEGTNVSRYINNLILTNGRGAADTQNTVHFTFIPEENEELYHSPKYTVPEMLMLYSRPLGQLSARAYSSFLEALKQNGLGYHYFQITADLTVGFVAVNREEASIQFARYYILDKETKEYIRTSLPLPLVRYAPGEKTIIIITKENTL